MFIIFNIIYIMRTLAYGGYIDMSALPLFFRLPILTLLRESYAGFGLHFAAEKLSKRHFLAETETLRTC